MEREGGRGPENGGGEDELRVNYEEDDHRGVAMEEEEEEEAGLSG